MTPPALHRCPLAEPADIHQLRDRTGEFRAVIEGHITKTRNKFARMAGEGAARYCPLCDYYGRFAPFGSPPRFDARCPSCASLERHRLIWLLILRRGLFGKDHRMLHFAAEGVLRRHLAGLVASYATAEIRADLQPDHVLNIEAIDLPDESFERVMCNHVLEHVDDARALREVFRILTPGGVAIFTTPVVEGWAATYENPAVTSKADRLLHFGQADHVRLFGRDLRDRIRAAGFQLDEFTAVEPDVHRYGLMRGETVFIATKPGVSP
jgi:SAM-dependent methyltransferase